MLFNCLHFELLIGDFSWVELMVRRATASSLIGPRKLLVATLAHHGFLQNLPYLVGHFNQFLACCNSFLFPCMPMWFDKGWHIITSLKGNLQNIIFIRAMWIIFCIYILTLKVLYVWKLTSYCSLKPLWLGMGEVVPARTSPTLHPPSPPTVHQLSRLAP